MNKDEQNKEITIVVNGTERTVTGKELSFAEIISLDPDLPPAGGNICFTMTYRKGDKDKPEGSLVEGDNIKLKKGMIFNVTSTDKS